MVKAHDTSLEGDGFVMNQAKVLETIAKPYGARPAISVGTEVYLTYRQMADKVACLAGGMQAQLGLQIGDRVALAMKNCGDYYPIEYACWHAGLASVPMNAKLHPREMAYILENSGARVCFATPDLAAELTALIDEIETLEEVVDITTERFDGLLAAAPIAVQSVEPSDLAWLFYTSGTTGRPKGAMITHRNMMSCTMNYYADIDQVTPYDTMIHPAPLSHGAGIYGVAFIAKGANNVVPASGGFEVTETLDLIAHWPSCSFFFAPTMVTRLISTPQIHDADTRNLRTIVYGGAPMYYEDTRRALDILGPKLAQVYGQGEAPMTITGLSRRIFEETENPDYEKIIATTGLARTDVEVRVVDADGTELPIGETGEVICRGDVVTPGYWRNPEANAKTFRDGWLWTGDVGSFDAEGYLTLKDRSKDMIISGGTNIYPREIEEVLLRHDAVLECAVIGRPHADWGEEVVAFISLRPGHKVSPAELDQLCLENIARFKRPKAYHFQANLPKNNYGKILKTELRQVDQEILAKSAAD